MIFLLDEHFPPQVAQALALLDQEDCQYLHSVAAVGGGAEDEALFAACRDSGWFYITLDQKISKKPAQRQALLDAGVGAFIFTGKSIGQWAFREIVAFVLRVTGEMIEKAKATKRPFIWGISDKRVFDRLDRT